MMQAAEESAQKTPRKWSNAPLVLGVTVLTSMESMASLKSNHPRSAIKSNVSTLAGARRIARTGLFPARSAGPAAIAFPLTCSSSRRAFALAMM